MVCRECGAYNAENLTHCRVCAAKLRDDAPAGENAQAADESRPARDFVKAPAWPTRAYTGADTEKAAPAPQAETVPAAPAAPAAATYTPSYSAQRPAAQTVAAQAGAAQVGATPARPARQPSAAQTGAPAAFCPNCGKPALAGALFCPYCGGSLSGVKAAPAAGASAAVPAAVPQGRTGAARPAAKPAVPAKRSAKFEDDYDDDYEDEDEDDFDDEPRGKKKKALKPAAKSKKAKKSRYEDDYDDEDEDGAFDEEYDDDDEFDDDYDDDDDMPKKKKSTTFLFWGLIVLLVALIAVFGIYIVNKNFGGDMGKMTASISSLFGKKTDTGDANSTGADGTDAVPVEEDNMYTATIEEYTDESTGEVFYDLNIYAPTGSTVRIVTDAQLKSDTATVPSNDHVVLRVARDVFMPNAPCDSETITISPDIQVDTPDGQTVQLKIDDISVTVPALTMTLTSPEGDTVQQNYNNDPILIQGTVDNTNVTEIYINGEARPISGGAFALSYTPVKAPTVATAAAAPAATDDAATADDAAADGADAAVTPAPTDDAAADDAATDDAATADDATADAAVATDDAAATDTAAPAATTATAVTDASGNETVTIEARLNNYVTARKVITIQPYVVQNMTLVITNDPATGLSSSEGTVTLQGNVSYTADAKIAASTDDGATAVTFGEPAISGTGSFSVQVSISEVGVYPVTLDSSATGYNPSTTSCIVERPPTEKSSAYLKKCTSVEKAYEKITSGETTSGNFQGTGKVTEILSTSPYTIFKIKLSGSDQEIVCVNRSTKSTINSSKIGDKKQVMGSLAGTYEETGLPYIWVWYILNK